MSNAEHKDIPESLPVIPTIDVVIFPKMVIPLLIVDPEIIKTIETACQSSSYILLVATKIKSDKPCDKITINDIYNVGTIGKIMKSIRLADSSLKILVQGCFRASVISEQPNNTSLMCLWENYAFKVKEENTSALSLNIKKILDITEKHNNSSNNEFGNDFQFVISQIKDPERLADFLISHMGLNVTHCQDLLEKQSISELIAMTHEHFSKFLEKTSVKESVKSSARNSINRNQREYFLREQLKAIKNELGEHEESEFEDLREKLKITPLSEEARVEAEKQLRRLDKTSADSLEATVIRNHLECLLGMPWGTYTQDSKNIKETSYILNKNHFGINNVKDTILDYLSVKCLQSKYQSQILCLLGAPGVGKTSIAKSIAESLGRKFVRIALGGVYDESEIRGHRRTYVGALPGRIIQAIKKSGSMNPILLIDEIDKLGSAGRGDPAAALLEVLDSEQNESFYDNYLGVPFNLSDVMFIATANDATTITKPLKDRMQVVYIPGYSNREKLKIAQEHSIPKIISKMGMSPENIKIPENALKSIIHNYTKESGIRELERCIEKICSKHARFLMETGKNHSLSEKNLIDFLGPKSFKNDYINFGKRIGVTNGLAWTAHGGEILQVEAILMPGKGNLTLTGQLGSIMKESAQAAVSYVRSKADVYKINKKYFTDYDLHIHLPAGAVPKDGPSAGVTLISSILSALTKRPINSKYAMTGEISLQGTILPIGGIKEKILAAAHYGLKHVILPEANRTDIEEDKTISIDEVELSFVDTIDKLLLKVLT